MASARDFAMVSALLLALIVWLRPVVGRLGEPEVADARGRAVVTLPAGVSTGGPVAVDSMVTAARPARRPAASGPVSELEEVERQVLEATNAERARRGLSPLAAEATLRLVARAHSTDMIERGFFDHVNPDGASPNDRVSDTHRRLVGGNGENIWKGSGFIPDELAKTIVDGWMASPGHRANILKPEYTHLGVGIVSTGDEVRATQSFAVVRALTAESVPAAVARGAAVDLSLEPGPGSTAKRFDLWSVQRGLKIAGPFDLPGAPIDVAPGVYQLRFYFPAGTDRYSISHGPRIEVR